MQGKDAAVEQSNQLLHHQFVLIPIKPNSVNTLLSVVLDDQICETISSLRGLNNLELYISGDVTDRAVAVFHACFASKTVLSDAAKTVQGLTSRLSDCIAAEPQLLSGPSLWRCVGSSVLDLKVQSSYCVLTTLPLKRGAAEFMVDFLKKPETKSIIASLVGCVGLECVKTSGVLVMASIFEDERCAKVADDVLAHLLEPVLSQWCADSHKPSQPRAC